MLYFDQIEIDKFGVIRQHVWLLVHLPFHISLVFLVEGVRQLIKWRSTVEVLNVVSDIISAAGDPLIVNGSPSQWVSLINGTIQEIFDVYRMNPATRDSRSSAAYQSHINGALSTIANSTSWESADFKRAEDDLLASIALYIHGQFSTEAPDTNAGGDSVAEFNHLVTSSTLVLTYSLITTGTSLILLGALMLLAQKWDTRGQRLLVSVRCVVGLAVALVSLVTLSSQYSLIYLTSSWVLPTLVLSLALG